MIIDPKRKDRGSQRPPRSRAAPAIDDHKIAERLAKAAGLDLTSEQHKALVKRLSFVRDWHRIWSGAVASNVGTAALRSRLVAAQCAANALEPLTEGALSVIIMQHGVDPLTIKTIIAAIRAAKVVGPPPKRGGAHHHGDVALQETVRKLVEAYRAITGRAALGGVSPLSGCGGPLIRFVAEYLAIIGERPRSPTAISGLIKRSVKK